MDSPEEIKPYNDSDAKGKQVGEMFDSIAPAYDFMNTAMTGGLHRFWRDRALRMALQRIGSPAPGRVLDVACGTGDVSFRLHELLPAARISGLDLSPGMLAIAQARLKKLDAGSREKMEFVVGDSLALPYPDDSFDLVTVAYGVRNFERLEDGYREMRRVLRPGGVICVVELSEPASAPVRTLYRLYSRCVIPFVGKLVSRDSRAYSYLPESIAACPQRDAMTAMMRRAGFSDPTFRSLTFGVVTIYIAGSGKSCY